MRKRRERSSEEQRILKDSENPSEGRRRTRARQCGEFQAPTTATNNEQSSIPANEAIQGPDTDPPVIRTDLVSKSSETIDVDSELMCALCHDLYVRPVSMGPCSHSFCVDCHLKLFTFRNHQEPGVPPGLRTRACPICRTPATLDQSILNKELQESALAKYPALYEKRLIEASAAINDLAARRPEYFTLTVGNTCQNTGMTTRSGVRANPTRSGEFYIHLKDQNGNELENSSSYIDFVEMHVHSSHTARLTNSNGSSFFSVPCMENVTRAERKPCCAIIHFKSSTRLPSVCITWLSNSEEGNHCLDVPLELIRKPEGQDGDGEDESPVDDRDFDALLGPQSAFRGFYPMLLGMIGAFF